MTASSAHRTLARPPSQPHPQRTDELAAEQAAPLRVPAQRLQVLLREGAAGPLRRLCRAANEAVSS